MTNLITEARELCERTVPAPWRTKDRGDYIEIHDNNTWAKSLSPFAKVEGDEFDSAEFIARSRTLIPELCDALEKARAEIERLKSIDVNVAITTALRKQAALVHCVDCVYHCFPPKDSTGCAQFVYCYHPNQALGDSPLTMDFTDFCSCGKKMGARI